MRQPVIADQTRNVLVGEPDETPVGPRLTATDPDGVTLTWSIVAGSAPADVPFEIDARTGQISVEISAGGLRVLNTGSYQEHPIVVLPGGLWVRSQEGGVPAMSPGCGSKRRHGCRSAADMQ
jgi:hypothetical protein